MRIADLDQLVLSCRHPQSKSLFEEAVKCYEAGAYRASIVTTWIAVVFDLIEKIRDLALDGDQEAAKVIGEVDGWQPKVAAGDQAAIRKSLEFEREILHTATQKFGLFDPTQTRELERLHQDRNQCAHPSYMRAETLFQPNPELARFHLRTAADYLLSQPAVQGKAAVDRIVAGVRSTLFPVELEKAKIALRKAGLERPRDSLVRAVTDELLFGFYKTELLKGRDETLTALVACHAMYPAQAEPRVKLALNKIVRAADESQYPLIFKMLCRITGGTDHLEQDNTNRLETFINGSAIKVVLPALAFSLRLPVVREASRARIASLSREELGKLISVTQDRIVVDACVSMYAGSKSWPQANSIYEACIAPILDTLKENDCQRIIFSTKIGPDLVRGSDLIGATSFNTFLSEVFRKQIIPRERFRSFLREADLASNYSRFFEQSNEEDDIPF